MSKQLVSDELWQFIEPLLPPRRRAAFDSPAASPWTA
mgnify:CR=1 FL=1